MNFLHFNISTYIELVALDDFRWRVVTIVMGLVVLVPLIALEKNT